MSAHPMLERTYSHKSDGRQSSAGHSVHSANSGRANSMGLDTPFSGLGHSTSLLEPPGLAPGLFILGTVPSIIRCWLDTNFKHESMLYAAVCTGSYASYLDQRLVDRLDFNDRVREDNGRRIKLPVFLPEAVTRMSSSRVESPAPQLPTITVDFIVVTGSTDEEDKSIQIFIGSDVLRHHNADILFSSNSITLYDDDRCKLSTPLVRPEDESTFKSLYVTSKAVGRSETFSKAAVLVEEQPILNGLKQTISSGSSVASVAATPLREPATGRDASPAPDLDEGPSRSSFGDDMSTTSTRRSFDSRPSLGILNTANESKPQSDSNPSTAPARSGPSPMIWSNWRRDSENKTSPQTDSWAKAGQTYQRREQGIKVLRPLKPASRTFSATSANANSQSPVTGQSRFFDEGRRRSTNEPPAEVSGIDEKEKSTKEGVPTLGSKTRSANPVGGASAFSWLGK
jgi:ubiquitin carboxyl-terminal hydrolase 4/11/15